MFRCKTCKTAFCYKCEFKEKIPCLLNQQKKCCVCARTCDCKRCNNKKRFPVPLEDTTGFPHLPRHGTRILLLLLFFLSFFLSIFFLFIYFLCISFVFYISICI